MATLDRQAKALLQKYQDTSLPRRWEEAVSFGKGSRADAFWIRDSGGVTNIVWLNDDGVRDIAIMPENSETTFNFTPLSQIATVEIREGQTAVAPFLPNVSGQMLVRVVVAANTAHTYWVADTEQEVALLRKFVAVVLDKYSIACR